MKGQRIFNELVNGGRVRIPGRKGRNNNLIAKRNDCLLARYYYYGYYKNKTYEDTIRQLVKEFFLSPNTIIAIIQNNTDALVAIKERSPVLYYFQNYWPHFKW